MLVEFLKIFASGGTAKKQKGVTSEALGTSRKNLAYMFERESKGAGASAKAMVKLFQEGAPVYARNSYAKGKFTATTDRRILGEGTGKTASAKKIKGGASDAQLLKSNYRAKVTGASKRSADYVTQTKRLAANTSFVGEGMYTDLNKFYKAQGKVNPLAKTRAARAVRPRG